MANHSFFFVLIFFLFCYYCFFLLLLTFGLNGLNSISHSRTYTHSHAPEKTHALSLNIKPQQCVMPTCTTSNTWSLTDTPKNRERDVHESDHNQSNWPFDFELKAHLQNVLSTVQKITKKMEKTWERKSCFQDWIARGLIVHNKRIFIDDIFSMCSVTHTCIVQQRIQLTFDVFCW